MFTLSPFGKFLGDRRGNVAMTFSLATLPMILAVGTGIDYSYASNAKAHMQAIADSAALAVTAASQTNATQSALETVARDYVNAQDWSRLLASRSDTVLTISTDKKYTVSFSGAVPTSFMKIVGIDTVDVRVSAQAVRATSGINEVALVLDTTGSMSGNKIATLKSAAKSMIEAVHSGGAQDVSFAVVPFAEYVNIGVSRRNEPWADVPANYSVTTRECFLFFCNNVTTNYKFNGCIGSRPSPYTTRITDPAISRYPGVMNATCSKELLPLTKDKDAALSAIDALSASGNTYIPGGLTWGWNVLSPAAPFTEGKPYDANNRQPRKVLVLMTDGENTISPVFPSGAHTGSSKSTANTLTAQLCTAIKADNIEIFTVAFQVSDESTLTMLQDCASSGGYSYNASDSTALTAAFSSIGQALGGARLTQ